jgi:hypothetical protein
LSNVLDQSSRTDMVFEQVIQKLGEDARKREAENSFLRRLARMRGEKSKSKSTSHQIDPGHDQEMHLERYSRMVFGLTSRGKKKPYMPSDRIELVLLDPTIECNTFYKRYLVEQLL